MADLEIQNLHVTVEDKEILKGVDLAVSRGEVHALMGPNGSGKSTLANTILGHPAYEITEGRILFEGKNITEAEPDERARAGLFMAFQYPSAIPGVSVVNFLRTAINAQRKSRGEDPISLKEFRKTLEAQMEVLGVDREFTRRYLNEGFSGGEKKRCEVLQMAILKPLVAVMDETDSGLDIDALRTVSNAVEKMRGPDLGHPDHHPLPADPELHQARLRPHHAERSRGRERRVRAGGPARGARATSGCARSTRSPRRRRPDGGAHRTGRSASASRRSGADFPLLSREFEGRPVAYLDNAATAQKPAAVIEAMDTYYRRSNANIHR